MYRIVLFGGCQRRRAAGGWNLDVGEEREEWRGAGLSLLSVESCVVLNRARAFVQVFYQPSSGDVKAHLLLLVLDLLDVRHDDT